MKLDVTQALRNPGQEYVLRVVQAIAPQDVAGTEVSFDDVSLDGTYFTADDGSVTVDGLLKGVAHSTCANCLEPASAEIQIEFHETFQFGGDPEDDETFTYEGSRVDFEKLAMSYAVLALPMRFLCKKGCKGYQGFYGADVTVGEEMPAPKQDNPFAALGQLLTPEFTQQFSGDDFDASPYPEADDTAEGADNHEEV